MPLAEKRNSAIQLKDVVCDKTVPRLANRTIGCLGEKGPGLTSTVLVFESALQIGLSILPSYIGQASR